MRVSLDGALPPPNVDGAPEAPPGKPTVDPKTLHAAKEFEAVFLRQMLTSLQKTTKSTMGGGTGSDTYSSFAVDSLADSLAQSGGIGLADAIVQALGNAALRPPSGGK